MNYVNSVLDVIGKTPLLKLNKVGKGVEANVFVKLEHLNPSGSYKDRMALAMVEAAERGDTWNGKKLLPGGRVVEASAGNTAPAVALVCAVKGYKSKIFLYRYNFTDGVDARLKITQAYGPEVAISSEPDKYLPEDARALFQKNTDLPHVIAGKKDCALEEERDPDAVWVDQIYNEANYLGQMEIGREIYAQLDGKIDAFGCSVSSGASLYGTCLGLEEKGLRPAVTFGVVPEGSEQYFDLQKEESDRDEFHVSDVRKKIAGAMGLDKWITQQSIVERMMDAGYPDKFFCVTTAEARAMANRLCAEEGLYCGMSSGANVAIALKIASRLEKGRNVVTLIVDRRDRYLSEYPNDKYVV
ncbi:MAG: cysteine synthase family protein [Synergistaceae bacterium]|jgi:cysteine synthase A|nr:cysteine synthase family protein [Synergistaceae bacterium]